MTLRGATAGSMVASLAAIMTLAAALVTAADGEVDSQAIEATLTKIQVSCAAFNHHVPPVAR